MKVSLVTISFNQAEFLERAIRSVIDQDYDDIEYIIVDPGSTDNSREIIERFRAKSAKLLLDPDKGPADGLNKGFAEATGEIYGFLNSDDVLLPGTIARVVRYFMEHPDVDVVSGHAIIIDEHDQEIRRSYSDRFSLAGYAYGASVLMQPSTFFKANIFKKVGGFNVSNRTNWDGEIFVDMRLKGAHFAILNEFLSGYRLHRDSITSSKKLDDGIKAYHQAMFRKIMGRNMRAWDMLPRVMFRLLKYASNPRALYERLRKGPVYGRGAKNAP